MSDRLEELRHELADVEAALEEAEAVPEGGSPDTWMPLRDRKQEIEVEILALERAAREEAGAQPETVEATAEEVEEARPAATDLVVPPSVGQEQREAVVMVLDKHDEDRILAALEERMDKVLLYDFPQDGSRLVDLSINGVMECVRQINQTQHARVRILPGSLDVEMTQLGDQGMFHVATVAAEDQQTGLVMYGTASEPVMAPRRSGPAKFDKFARAKAISKAQRNALKQHIPERLRQAVIAMHKGDANRVLEVKHGAGATAAAQLPPPVDSPAAKELEAQCRRVWAEIRGLPRWQEKKLPGMFNQELSHARSSEVALEAFRDSLVSLRDALTAAASA